MNWYTKMNPKDHTIHLCHGEWTRESSQKGPQAKMSTWGSPNLIRAPLRASNPPPGMKKQKMRTKIPRRTPPSENQTEPYGASYGQNQFRAGPLNVAISC